MRKISSQFGADSGFDSDNKHKEIGKEFSHAITPIKKTFKLRRTKEIANKKTIYCIVCALTHAKHAKPQLVRHERRPCEERVKTS